MHELSVLAATVDLAEQTALENGVKRIAYLTLEVGELSGYLPVFFTKYYPVATEGKPLFEGSELRIVRARGEGLCLDCDSIYDVFDCEGVCPACGSRRKKVLGGEHVMLLDIGVAE